MISLRISLLLSVLFGVLAIIIKYKIIDYLFIINIFNKQTESIENGVMFTEYQLTNFDGTKNENLYLAILGTVYDVTRASKHYGPGQTYHIFIGKDASRSFITGEFDGQDVSDDVVDLKPDELLSLKKWQQFYDKEYIYKGKLIGKYYNEQGEETQYKKIVENLIKNAELNKNEKNLEEQLFPPCNVEWDAEHGTRVWCSDRSGGIERNWVGVPRKYYKPGSSTHRCACIEKLEDNPQIEQYENCKSDSITCYVLS